MLRLSRRASDHAVALGRLFALSDSSPSLQRHAPSPSPSPSPSPRRTHGDPAKGLNVAVATLQADTPGTGAINPNPSPTPAAAARSAGDSPTKKVAFDAKSAPAALYARLEVESYVDVATTATPTSPTAEASSRRCAADPASVLAGLHVLVVEDSPVARTMLVRLLKAMGCTADEAEDGQQAVDKVQGSLGVREGEERPSGGGEVGGCRGYDLILCDSVMPVMDGPTAVRHIRGMGYDRPILGVTGNTLPEQVAEFLEHGADDVVGKPVRQQVLKDALKAQLLKSQKNVEG